MKKQKYEEKRGEGITVEKSGKYLQLKFRVISTVKKTLQQIKEVARSPAILQSLVSQLQIPTL